MYGWDTLMLLMHYLESGLSKTAVARQPGVSRRAIYHWIRTGQLDRELSRASAVGIGHTSATCGTNPTTATVAALRNLTAINAMGVTARSRNLEGSGERLPGHRGGYAVEGVAWNWAAAQDSPRWLGRGL